MSQSVHEDGQKIDIQANKVSLQNQGKIIVRAYGKGNGTDIKIEDSEEISIIDGIFANGSFHQGPSE